MQVILLEKITHLGDLGDIVKVKDGYGRNFPIPQGQPSAPPSRLSLSLRLAAPNSKRLRLNASPLLRISPPS